MSFYDDASLVVIPSGFKTSKVYAEKPTDGSGDLAFTRTGDTATRVNSAGIIEKVRTNYARQSQSFATAAVWSATNGTLTNNAGTAPDGTNTASKIVATNTDPFCYQSITLTGPVVASCYVKAVGSAIGKSAEIRAGISLTNFTLSGSWQRVSVTHTASGAHNYGLEVPNPGVIGDEVLLWGFQVEGGDVVTDYIPTTTAAVSVGMVANTPRLDFLGSTCPRLLLEPQRTNTILYSEQINTTNWPASTRINVTANALISPDGYQNADIIIPNTTSGNHGPAQNVSGLTSGATYSCSIYAKAQGYSKFLILAGAGTGSGQYEFDLTAGTAQAGATITSVGNGWYRCTAPLVPNSSLLQYLIFISNGSAYSYTGNGTSGIAFWGAQLEAGAYATSYIPTLAASATRGADACSKTGISSLIGQTEGTLFAEFNVGGADGRVISTLGGSNRFGMTASPTAVGFFIVTAAGGVVYSSSASFTHGAITKMALAYKSGESVLYVNGSAVLTTTATFSFNAAITDLYLSQQEFAPGAGQTGKSQAQALLFKTRLTNAELATLTTL